MKEVLKTEIKFRLNENLPRIEKCLNLLTEDQVWYRSNENTNSIGNLILHLAGNIRQYGINGLSKNKDTRKRDLEFKADKTHSKKELFQIISSTIAEANTSIDRLSMEELEANYSIQGFQLTGVSVVVHIAEHLSYHVGQIALITKSITNKDVGFYKDFHLSRTD